MACHDQVMRELCRAQIERLPLSTLREASQGRLNLAPLHNQGYHSVAEIFALDERRLESIPGVGPATAKAILAAREALWRSVVQETSFRIKFDPSDTRATTMLQALETYSAIKGLAEPVWARLWDLSRRLAADLGLAAVLGGWRWLVSDQARRRAGLDAAWRLKAVLDDPDRPRLEAICHQVVDVAKAAPTDPWPRFEKQASNYYALLGEFVETATPIEAAQGYIADEIVRKVQDQVLDRSLLRVDLRGYQVFGAKFALVQKRIILGDEMGLGKTIQALAAICHRIAVAGANSAPILVICPASVMSNWSKELADRTCLEHIVIHGYDRQDEVDHWLATRCVGVTTFDTVKGLSLPPGLHLEALVVDEAHYVKNPKTERAHAIHYFSQSADHVWFLTGTPMENKVDEFATLVRYLQSDALPVAKAPLGPTAFRRSVSPVYLRRNAADVLMELPGRIEQDERVAFTASDEKRYAAAVRSGNLMAIRQAGYGDSDCAKLERFIELVAEAGANGLKVVAYSFFLKTLELARQAAPVPGFGPLTGQVPARTRQRIIDQFSAHAGPGLLLSQIKAAGIGVNLQAASVVILLEPQLTPTAEEQAIARSYRMGQVRPVQVYRLLAENSIDETLTQLLQRKTRDFDQFARRSEVAETSADAVDVSLDNFTRQLVAAEQARDLR